MANEYNKSSEVKNFNPNREISIELVLDILLKHRNAVYKSWYGKDIGADEPLNSNDRIKNQVSALREIIGSQTMMIDLVGRPNIEKNCLARWYKKYKTKEEKKDHPFKEEINDMTKLIEWRDFLKYCLEQLRHADITPSLEDDFMITKINQDGDEENELTNNFFEMRDELAESYNGIYGLLIEHEIVTQKDMEDEELTYREQEELFLERFKEA